MPPIEDIKWLFEKSKMEKLYSMNCVTHYKHNRYEILFEAMANINFTGKEGFIKPLLWAYEGRRKNNDSKIFHYKKPIEAIDSLEKAILYIKENSKGELYG